MSTTRKVRCSLNVRVICYCEPCRQLGLLHLCLQTTEAKCCYNRLWYSVDCICSCARSVILILFANVFLMLFIFHELPVVSYLDICNKLCSS